MKKLVIVLALSVIGLAGCGQTGVLYMPAAKPAPTPAPVPSVGSPVNPSTPISNPQAQPSQTY